MKKQQKSSERNSRRKTYLFYIWGDKFSHVPPQDKWHPSMEGKHNLLEFMRHKLVFESEHKVLWGKRQVPNVVIVETDIKMVCIIAYSRTKKETRTRCTRPTSFTLSDLAQVASALGLFFTQSVTRSTRIC